MPNIGPLHTKARVVGTPQTICFLLLAMSMVVWPQIILINGYFEHDKLTQTGSMDVTLTSMDNNGWIPQSLAMYPVGM